MRIAIIGAGGVGGYLGGCLAAVGHQVAFLARGGTLEALRRDGIRVESPDGDVQCAVEAVDTVAALREIEAVIVAVKSWQVAELAGPLRSLAGNSTVFLTLQNGVEAPDRLATAVPAEQILGGVCILIAHALAPGHIRHVGGRPSIEVGPIASLDRRVATRADNLREALGEAGISCSASTNIRRSLWRKFLLITSYGGIGALAQAPVGITRSVPKSRELIEQAMAEVVAVAHGHGVTLSDDDVKAMMGQVDAFEPQSTASMQRDIADGRPSELADQSGAVVRLGVQAGVSTPVHRVIYGSLLPSEQRARGELEY